MARPPADLPFFTARELTAPLGRAERALARMDAWLDRQLGYHPLAIRLNHRHGFHAERMQPGHPNWMLDTDRDGPLPRWRHSSARCSAGSSARGGTFRGGCSRRCAVTAHASCSRTCSPQCVAVPCRGTSPAGAGGRARGELGPHGRKGRHLPALRSLRRSKPCHGGRPAPLPRDRARAGTGSRAGRRRISSTAGGPRAEFEELLTGTALDSRRPLVLVAGNTPSNAPYEGRFVERLVAWWEQDAGQRFQLLFRPHTPATVNGESASRSGGRARRSHRAGGELHRPRRPRDPAPARRRRRLQRRHDPPRRALVGDRPVVCVLYDEALRPVSRGRRRTSSANTTRSSPHPAPSIAPSASRRSFPGSSVAQASR